MVRIISIAILLFIALPALAQEAGKLSGKHRRELADAEKRMTELTTRIYTDSSEQARYTACKELIKTLVTALDRPNSFAYTFGDIPGLSITYPADNSFRIFTWELFVNRDNYRHYGAVQRNSKRLDLIPLLDRGDEWLNNPENKISSADDWLGYVAYNIHQGGEFRGAPYYFLFGYDSFGTYTRRKLVDVLYFEPLTGEARFGMPIFETYTETDLPLEGRARIILEYGAEATTMLRYDETLDGIVYENLVMMPSTDGDAPVYLPDGSYHFLGLGADGMWREQEQLFDHIYEEAPREAARPDDGGRDILGRPRGGGGGQ